NLTKDYKPIVRIRYKSQEIAFRFSLNQ
ncbi:MAG: hypothetical protein ACI9E3_000333, partial [Flavobacteriales bacterium]